MLEDGRLYISRKKTILNREQKVGFWMVAGFGVLALIFGTFYLWKHVASPFVLSYTGPKFLTGDQQQQEEMEKLRKEDTDEDGLNDYDELYVYRTSPYIADSDSDGADDKTEIANGEDPNCAPSMPCGAANDTVNPTTLKGTFVDAAASDTAASVAQGASSAITSDVSSIAEVLAQMTSDEIRQLLIESGGDVTAVNALTDDELRTALAEALQAIQLQQAGTDATVETGVDTTTQTTTQ
ncbi:MAG: hypothetical protein WCT28_01395 [Patescibacteria group bacterium]